MSDRILRQRPRVKSPAPGASSTQARPKPKHLSPSQPKSRTCRKNASISPAKDGVPSHYFTPRKAFSQEVASSPLISDLEMDALTAECGDIMRAVEGMTSEEEASPMKMGPPSTQKYHAVETPNSKKDREMRLLLLQDLECSESERDTPYKSDIPRRQPSSNQAAITPEAGTSIQREEEAPKTTKAAPGLVANKSMSTRQPSSSSEDDSSDEEKSEASSGDELDIYSSNFNPQLALSMGRRFFKKLPHPMTKKLKSLEQYGRVAAKTAVDGDFEKHMMRALKHKKKKEKEVTKRNFLPEQGPVAGTYWTQQTKNLVDRMENFTGPMAKLKEYREKKIRIMVKTRNIYSGTNDMVAYVAAFDKHWNMALTDVEETFLRKLRRKIPIQMGETVKVSEEELEKRGLVRPKVIKKVGAKFELCKRYIPQLMIRGEQIVIVYPVV